MKSFLSKLGLFNYTVHNIFAHPLMEILHLIGLTKLGDKVHDMTLPALSPPTNPPQKDHVSTEDRVKELEQKLSTLKAEIEPYREADRLYSEWFSCMGVPYSRNSTIKIATDDLQRKVSEFQSASEEKRIEMRAEFKRNLP